jgi:hypothetical protein
MTWHMRWRDASEEVANGCDSRLISKTTWIFLKRKQKTLADVPQGRLNYLFLRREASVMQAGEQVRNVAARRDNYTLN